MPLDNGYGVVAGTLHNYYRDPINDYGQYYHANVEVSTPSGVYHCAIDIDSKSQPNGVEWRVVELGPRSYKGVHRRESGWWPLASTGSSGAADDVRSRILAAKPRAQAEAQMRAVSALYRVDGSQGWSAGTSIDALQDLEPLIFASKRLFIFGEPFTNGLGVHNIHQNQGDPEGSQWWDENGIWQDGATLVERDDGTFAIFLNKFKTQAYLTDRDGHPVDG